MRSGKILYPILSIATILLIWLLINILGIVNPLFIPALDETLEKVGLLLSKHSTYHNIALTAYRALSGLLLAMVVGIPLGLLLARIRWAYDFFIVPIEFFRAVPSSALFPLFVLFFGIGNASKISVVFYACSLILLINAFYGAMKTQDKVDRINMLKSFGANNFQIFKYTIFQDALPNISAGIRVCLSYSFALVVVTEMFLGANEGLGKMIYDFYLQYRIPDMYAAISILGTMGFLINQLYIKIEKRYIFWANK